MTRLPISWDEVGAQPASNAETKANTSMRLHLMRRDRDSCPSTERDIIRLLEKERGLDVYQDQAQ